MTPFFRIRTSSCRSGSSAENLLQELAGNEEGRGGHSATACFFSQISLGPLPQDISCSALVFETSISESVEFWISGHAPESHFEGAATDFVGNTHYPHNGNYVNFCIHLDLNSISFHPLPKHT